MELRFFTIMDECCCGDYPGVMSANFSAVYIYMCCLSSAIAISVSVCVFSLFSRLGSLLASLFVDDLPYDALISCVRNAFRIGLGLLRRLEEHHPSSTVLV